MTAAPVAVALAFLTLLEVGTLRVDDGATLLAQRGGRRGATRGQPQGDVRSLLRGQVTQVGGATGRIAIDVDGTVLEARYPPETVAGMKVGDIVFIDLTIIDIGRATVPGSVTEVDSQPRVITVKTRRGLLKVPSAPTALERIKAGDQVVLRLGLVDIGSSFEPK